MAKSPQQLKQVLKGVIPIMFTPFKSSTELDEEGMRKNTRFLIENGIVEGRGALVVGGSNGECFNMSIPERKRLFEIVVDEANGKVPVIACCNQSGTHLVIDLAKHAEKIGADGLMITPTYYQTPDDTSIYKHYEAIANATNLGIMVYNNQWVTGRDIPLELLKRLAEIENVVALKDCTPSFEKMWATGKALADKINIISCFGFTRGPCDYIAGAVGGICRICNFAPRLILDWYDAAVARDLEKLDELYDKLMPFEDFFVEGGEDVAQALCKQAMEWVGLVGGFLRLPLYEPSQEQKNRLRKLLQNAKIL